MNNFKYLFILIGVIGFTISPVLRAQDAPPVPRIESKSADSDSTPQEDQQSADDKPADEKKADQDESPKKSSDKSESTKKSQEQESEEKDSKQDDKKPEMNPGDDKKSGDQEPDDKKSDDKKSDDKKSDDKKSDEEKDKKPKTEKSEDKPEKKADGEKDEDEKSIAEKTLEKLRPVRISRDQQRIGSYSKQSDAFVKIFEPIVASVNESTLQVVSGKRPIALGTVVDSNGLILTKASELRGDIGCKLNDGTILKAKVIGIDPETDLALLKIDAENLNVAQWSDEPTPITGRWLATPKASSDDQPTIGIVSVDAREIKPSQPFIGIQMENVEDGGGVRIFKVIARSPADFADLWVNDVIVSIDNEVVKDIESVRDKLGQYEINDRISVGILRGDKKMNIRLTLAEKDKVSPDHQRSNMQNSMGSILSRRRKDFPNAFQHDSMLSSKTCGGPIVDLSGKIVGINIARAGRVSSLAIPANLAREIVEELRTGKLAPEVVNKEAIEKISLELEEMKTKYSHLPEKKSVLELKYNLEKARLSELNKSMAELRKRIKVIEEQSKDYKEQLSSLRKQILSVEKNRERLEADRDQLRTGSR